VETARTESANYRAQYGSNIPLKFLNERVSMYMHAYTLYSAVRPFGCSVILGAYEADGPVMYMIDPSGVSYVSITVLLLIVKQQFSQNCTCDKYWYPVVV
jgi:20S proteasome subunit alpha 7